MVEIREAPVPVSFRWLAVSGMDTSRCAWSYSVASYPLQKECDSIKPGDRLQVSFNNKQIVIVRAKK